MGILNVTPDSFSDGSELAGNPDRVRERALAMARAGAALVDVGGESTRPGAAEVPEAEELDRVLPVLQALVPHLPIPISIDTRKAGVAEAALAAGAGIVNDVSGLRHDPAMAGVVAGTGAGLVLMHMRGDPASMRERAVYHDVVAEVRSELAESVAAARAAGVDDAALVLDPGLGFAKTPEHNLTLLRHLDRLIELGFPLLVGPSRKSFLARILTLPDPHPRAALEAGTVAACVAAYLQGARVFRVHDVGPVAQALSVAEAIARGGR